MSKTIGMAIGNKKRAENTEIESLRQQFAESSVGWHNANMLALENGAENDQLREQLGTTEDHLRRVEQAFESTNAKLREHVTLLREALQRRVSMDNRWPDYVIEAIAATEPTL